MKNLSNWVLEVIMLEPLTIVKMLPDSCENQTWSFVSFILPGNIKSFFLDA